MSGTTAMALLCLATLAGMLVLQFASTVSKMPTARIVALVVSAIMAYMAPTVYFGADEYHMMVFDAIGREVPLDIPPYVYAVMMSLILAVALNLVAIALGGHYRRAQEVSAQ